MEAIQHGQQISPERGQAVVHTGWHLGMNGAGQNAIPLQIAQVIGEHLLADAIERTLQIGETPRARRQRPQSQLSPAITIPLSVLKSPVLGQMSPSGHSTTLMCVLVRRHRTADNQIRRPTTGWPRPLQISWFWLPAMAKT